MNIKEIQELWPRARGGAGACLRARPAARGGRSLCLGTRGARPGHLRRLELRSQPRFPLEISTPGWAGPGLAPQFQGSGARCSPLASSVPRARLGTCPARPEIPSQHPLAASLFRAMLLYCALRPAGLPQVLGIPRKPIWFPCRDQSLPTSRTWGTQKAAPQAGGYVHRQAFLSVRNWQNPRGLEVGADLCQRQTWWEETQFTKCHPSHCMDRDTEARREGWAPKDTQWPLSPLASPGTVFRLRSRVYGSGAAPQRSLLCLASPPNPQCRQKPRLRCRPDSPANSHLGRSVRALRLRASGRE